MFYYPGFARWIEVTPPKGLEIFAKTWIPTFTHCPGHFLRFRLGKSFREKENSPEVLGNCEAIWRIRYYISPLVLIVLNKEFRRRP